MEARSRKKVPEVKAWVRRMAEVSGFVPESAAAEAKLGWYGVELAKFLNFCKGLPGGTDLRHGMEGYGRFLKGAEPPLPDWRLEQVREALRLFQRGEIHGWRIGKADEKGEVKVDFRVKTAGEKAEEQTADTRSPVDGSMGAGGRGDWLVKADGVMRVSGRRGGSPRAWSGGTPAAERAFPNHRPAPRSRPGDRSVAAPDLSFRGARQDAEQSTNSEDAAAPQWRRKHAGICAGG